MNAEVVNIQGELKGVPLVRSRMKLRGMKQKDLAEIIGVSASYLSLLLNGERQINLDIAQQFAQELGGNSEDYISELSGQTSMPGLIVGDALKAFCREEANIVGFDAESVKETFVELRADDEIMVFRRGSDNWSGHNIQKSAYYMNFGDVIRISSIEKLNIGVNVVAEIDLLHELAQAGVMTSRFKLSPGTSFRPRFTIQYLGVDSIPLNELDPVFSAAFFRV